MNIHASFLSILLLISFKCIRQIKAADYVSPDGINEYCIMHDDDQEACEEDPECRFLTGDDVSPFLRQIVGLNTTCVRWGSCDSDCSICYHSQKMREASNQRYCDWGSRANCKLKDGECTGNSCGTNCEFCVNDTQCNASLAEPWGCKFDYDAGECLPAASVPLYRFQQTLVLCLCFFLALCYAF